MSDPGTPPTYRSGTQSVPARGLASTPQERAAALAFLQKLAAEVSEGSIDLPCFPDVVIRISTALADPNTTSDHVVTIVGAEPRLAARILQTANSAAFNTSGKRLTELRSAITRLGHQMLHGTAMSYAMQQMKNEASLRSIAQPLMELWNKSIAVASISRIVARRTKVNPDEAFLTGLLHGIGSLYIMARAAPQATGLGTEQFWSELLDGWQASIGKAVLESWGFAEEMCDAVGEQADRERRWKHEAALTDVLIASLVLADALKTPGSHDGMTKGVNAFQTVGVAAEDCAAILSEAEKQISLVHEALAA
ncbi:MAG TPA: HDOD domain-containing protein [Steroidobacteraceae bacterium]|jgi:HD-like signal output (HDOD) protein|nr:HDOD domain-containing protein [Steroidobacteraceae bacterium]